MNPYYLKNPYYAVQKSIADGELQRGSCEICDGIATRGHHDDYSKPLDVRWLCPVHHAQWHKNNKAIGQPPSLSTKGVKTIYLPHDLMRQLAKTAKAANVSQSVYVMQVLRAHFKAEETK